MFFCFNLVLIIIRTNKIHLLNVNICLSFYLQYSMDYMPSSFTMPTYFLFLLLNRQNINSCLNFERRVIVMMILLTPTFVWIQSCPYLLKYFYVDLSMISWVYPLMSIVLQSVTILIHLSSLFLCNHTISVISPVCIFLLFYSYFYIIFFLLFFFY